MDLKKEFISEEDNTKIELEILSANFPETEKKDELSKDIILNIIEKINLSNSHKKINANDLFLQLDSQNTEKITKYKFFDYINKYLHSDQTLKTNNESGKLKIFSRSDKIIFKLKKLKEKHYFQNDKDLLSDINWIISEISDSDLYEPEYKSLSNLQNEANKTGNIDNKNTVEYLSQFSKYWDHSRKEADLKQIKYTKTFKRNIIKRQHTVSIDNLFNMFEKENSHKNVNSNRDSVQFKNINLSNSVKLAKITEKIFTFDFDIFELDELILRKTLYFLANEIFIKYEYLDRIKEGIFQEFIEQIVSGYNREVTYHNDLHAGDVLQTVFMILQKFDFEEQLKLEDLDIISLFISAIIHDFKHPGFNNMYQINFKSKNAIKYNDSSVLESFHVSQAFKIILKPNCNILSEFSPEEFRMMRRRIIECVLATDMANHSRHYTTLKSKIEILNIKEGKNVNLIIRDTDAKNFESQQLILSNFIHAADISNPVKPEKVYDTWVKLLFEEFYKQGDEEKKNNLPISLMCDRKTTNIDKSQIGFINFIVYPLWELIWNISPETLPYLNNIKNNLIRYEEKVKKSN